MNKLILDKELLYKQNDDDESSRIQVDMIYPFLNYELELTEGTTLGHLWKYIEEDSKLIEDLFCGALGGHSLEKFVEEAKNPLTEEQKQSKERIERLEIGYCAEVWDYNPGSGEPRSFESGIDIYGIGPQYENQDIQSVESGDRGKLIPDGVWGISFQPLNYLMSLPLNLSNTFTLRIYDTQNPSNIQSIECSRCPLTVYEVLYAILYEITWYGEPESRDDVLSDIKQSIEEHKNNPQKVYSIEEVKKEFSKNKE